MDALRWSRHHWAAPLLFVAALAGAGIAARAGSQQPAALVPAAAPARPDPAMPAPMATRPLDAADLGAWLDGMFPAALDQGEIAGVVISVVKDGRVLLTRGYGHADVARGTPMDPATTLIRPGSTSKLFTWTAVMQLVEQGKLDLNADVNRYLDFRIEVPTGARPITLTDLMTHRAGFEEGLKDVLAVDAGKFQSLPVYLKSHVPPVMFPPGEVPAYSNYGTALAGYIVQRASGERSEDYVQHHIFAPLAMTRSSFRQPLPPALAALSAKGYRTADGPPQPFELVTPGPAGGLSTTANDMANFMLAHLDDGRFGGGQILRPETAQLMHRASLPHLPGFDAMAHGFFLNQRNGRAVLEHGGDTIVFHSDLAIVPAERTGIFFSFNSRGAGDAVYGVRERLLDGFMDRYFPAPPAADPPPLATARAHGEAIAGRYESSRRVEHGFIGLFYVLQGQDVVSVNPDATLAFDSAPGKRFREIAPWQWREVGGAREIAMRTVGGVRTLIDSRNPAGVLQPVPIGRDAGLNLKVFGVAVLILLLTAVLWPVTALARRRYGQAAPTGPVARARRWARIAAVADLAYLFAWFLVLKPILDSNVAFYSTSIDWLIRTLQIAGLVPLAGAVAGVVYAWRSLRSDQGRIVKLGAVLGAAALLGVVWIAWVGGLIGFGLNY
ncbi:serine hydrolase [Sphingomonas sp.]|uniref:serine hydrolase domain-containing protein n=1 Tax=Sphingomonas sp. TaxID=28214 RepID=UPI003B005CCD